ncbi:MAG: hypothetical protein J6Y85_02140 [Alphaproteobacteria bacterium]|nr:hypothetical protein [Alphaproteobacteria bacterium]
MSRAKVQTIRPEDSREYISYQFKTLQDSLKAFDYMGMAQIVEAAHHVFMDSDVPNKHLPDPILLECQNLK